MLPRKLVCLIRHGETEWSLNGRHTGRTDIPLTDNGRRMAMSLKSILGKIEFSEVLRSPMERVGETCELAGLGAAAKVDNDLHEWDYGEYEGLTSAQIHAKKPGWMIFKDGCPGGETPEETGNRVDRLMAKAHESPGNVAFFGHGHLFRVFVARWIGLRVLDGCRFLLEPATLNVLGYYMGIPAIRYWNFRVH